jgi:phosphinothricin acetyltransferase
MEIRDATAADLLQIRDIYNSILLASTAIYNDRPVTLEDRETWWRARLANSFPVVVAVDDTGVLGYGSFGDFRPWPGYRFTVEGTIHIRDGVRGQGIGTRLLDELITRARALGKHVMVAGVDSENAASLHFLTTHGFAPAGELREVGYKFGRYLHLNFLQLFLNAPGELPAQPGKSEGAET